MSTHLPTYAPLISTADAARMLGISCRQLLALTRSGRLPAPVRLGHKTLRHNRQEIAKALAADL